VNVAATHFGIALPKWIVEKQNSIWVSQCAFISSLKPLAH